MTAATTLSSDSNTTATSDVATADPITMTASPCGWWLRRNPILIRIIALRRRGGSIEYLAGCVYDGISKFIRILIIVMRLPQDSFKSKAKVRCHIAFKVPMYCVTVHCHGPVVRVTSPHPPCVEIVAETKDVLVVSKTSNYAHLCMRRISPKRPRSIIGAGSGRTVTTTSISTTTTNATLIYELSIGSLTSGFVIYAKSPDVAQQWANVIQERGRVFLFYQIVFGTGQGSISRSAGIVMQ